MKVFEVLKQILLTEKSNLLLSEQQKYVFCVDKSATKSQIARAVEEVFGVSVDDVNIINCPCKRKRVRSRTRNRYTLVNGNKKAIVLLKDGNKIDVA